MTSIIIDLNETLATQSQEGGMSVYHSRNLGLRESYDRAFDLCIESLGLIDRCTIQSEDRSEGQIVARAGMTWRTWGDLISFQIRRTDEEGILVEVASRPMVGSTLVDFGKNRENIEKISGFLIAHSGKAVTF